MSGQLPERMFLRLGSKSSSAHTHCSVLEFTAPSSSVVIPQWVMQNLGVDSNSAVSVTVLDDLPAGAYAKLQPQSIDFLELEHPQEAYVVVFVVRACVRAATCACACIARRVCCACRGSPTVRASLEVAFQRLLCVTKGDIVRFQHFDTPFYCEVVDLKPESAVHLINTDLKVRRRTRESVSGDGRG